MREKRKAKLLAVFDVQEMVQKIAEVLYLTQKPKLNAFPAFNLRTW